MWKRSIRWRLTLSFALLALLVTLALGILLLGILRDYYEQQEHNYLESNASAISSLVTNIVKQNPTSTDLQAQIESLTFLTQSRIRLLDPYKNAIVDSGLPFNTQMMVSSARDLSDQTLYFKMLDEPPTGLETMEAYELEVFLNEEAPTDETTSVTTIKVVAPQTEIVLLTNTLPVSGNLNLGTFSVMQTIYGLKIGENDVVVVGSRSGVTIQQPVWRDDGTLWGYVELSEGPTYGAQIVESAANAWGIAGAIAILLAAGIGWVMSRNFSAPLVTLTETTAQMAVGDLSARAPATTRTDELGTLSRAFNQMAERVEETVATLHQFISDAAHELHTPLTALRTNLELANEAPNHDTIARAQAQVTRLESLTTGLLDLSRIEAGELSCELVDIVALVHELIEFYASQAEQAEITFTATLPDTSAKVLGDTTQLNQALTNLLDNALKFTPPGGIVKVIVTREAHKVVVRIEDTGIGIPTEDIPHLFQRFHRGSNAAGYPGSGLGLAIVQAIIESYGGTVTAEAQAQGTCFNISLPIEPT